MLTRTNKDTGQETIFRPGGNVEAVKQYRKDFDIKTDVTAKVHLYDLLMYYREIRQNHKIMWRRTE